MRNVDIVLQWANALYKDSGRLQMATGEEANRRAEICSRCPLQMEWVRDCPNCVQSAQRYLSILRQGRDTPHGNAGLLKGCNAMGWDNRTAVHLDRAMLPPANPPCPNECWLR